MQLGLWGTIRVVGHIGLPMGGVLILHLCVCFYVCDFLNFKHVECLSSNTRHQGQVLVAIQVYLVALHFFWIFEINLSQAS
jgi:hypothetical protein